MRRLCLFLLIFFVIISLAQAENMFQGTVGIFCVQSVNDSDSGGGAYPPSAVQAARFCEYYGMNAGMIEGGDILLMNRSIKGLKSHVITELGISRTFQNIRLFNNMTAIENILVGRHCRMRAGVWGAIIRNRSTLRSTHLR